jgi:hypothetical protein
VPADEKPGAEIDEDDQPEHHIQRLDQRMARRERGRDDERQRHQIEDQQAVAEPVRVCRVALVEMPQPALEVSELRCHSAASAD